MIWGRFGEKSLKFIKTPIKDDARINVLEGSVRSGKTISMIPKWIDYILNAPDGLLLMSGKTKQTLKTNVLNDLFDTVGSQNYKYNRQTGELQIYNRKLLVVGANDERAEEYIRGATFAGAYCDEASLYPESFFKQLLNRCSIEDSKIYVTTNPDSPFHYIYTDFITDQSKLQSGMVKVWHFELDDNPNLSQEYLTFIKSAYSGLWYKRMILGLWVVAEGAIYDNFDSNRHVITADKLPKKFDRILIGIDYGQNNPTVYGKMGITHRADGKPIAWIFDEYYHDGGATSSKTTLRYKEDFLKFVGKDKIYGIYADPSATSLITEFKSSSLGVSLSQYMKRVNNSVLDGINSVSTFIDDNRLFVVGEKCPNAVKEFASYSWDPKAQKLGEDKPLKTHDHFMDGGVRYPIQSTYPAAKIQGIYI